VRAQFADRLQLPFHFDPSRLREDLDALGNAAWLEHFVKQNYDGDWSVIPLRAQAGAVHPVMLMYSNPAATEFTDTPLLARTPYFRRVLQDFACPLHCVRLMRLTPGSAIKEHRDDDLAAEFGSARLHIPITTNPDTDFRLNGTRVIMRPGSVWYLRLSDPHSVANRGTDDRVHLVIDAVVNDWLETQLAQASLLLPT
jgi:hypothetical protein